MTTKPQGWEKKIWRSSRGVNSCKFCIVQCAAPKFPMEMGISSWAPHPLRGADASLPWPAGDTQADEVSSCLPQATTSNHHSEDPKITSRPQEPTPTLRVFQLCSLSGACWNLRPGAGHSPTWISCRLNPSGFPSPQEIRAHCYCWTFHTETKANSACNKNNHHQRGQFHNKRTYYSLSELVVSGTKLPRVFICWPQFTFGISFRAAHKF